MSLRDLERDYEKSEDDIKALQSVGQIIGEVLKQLDEERCTSTPQLSRCMHSFTVLDLHSHCQGFIWASLCGWVQGSGA